MFKLGVDVETWSRCLNLESMSNWSRCQLESMSTWSRCLNWSLCQLGVDLKLGVDVQWRRCLKLEWMFKLKCSKAPSHAKIIYFAHIIPFLF